MNLLARLSALLALAFCAGCSSFQQKWDAAGKPGRFQNASRWDGRWTSAIHTTSAGKPAGGRLRCVLEPSSDSRQIAHFRADWMIFSTDYELPLVPQIPPRSQRNRDSVDFRGSHELSKIFGGTYRYEAQIRRERFTARYDSSYDKGTFEMTRQLTKATRIH